MTADLVEPEEQEAQEVLGDYPGSAKERISAFPVVGVVSAITVC